MCCCIGSSKLFRYDSNACKIVELTENNISLAENNSETEGGKLGPAHAGQADLSNFSLYSQR